MKKHKQFFQLLDVIPIDIIEEILKHFSEATGVNSMLIDHQGNPLVHFYKFIPFCEKLRKYPEGGHGCMKSDAYAGLEAFHSGKPYIYRCHMGIVDLAVPITINGQYLGAIMSGQLTVEKENLKNLDYITKPCLNVEDFPDLHKLYMSIEQTLPIIPLKKLEAYSRLLYTCTNYIAEVGYKRIIQKQLSDQEVLVLQKTAANAELEKSLVQLELKNMQSQMNPHFIFNTLNSINQQAILEGAEITPQIISAFSGILKRSLRKIDQPSTFEEEFECINNYIFIKKISIRDRIKVETNIDETCFDGQLPILTIQPLIENAFIHGLEPKEDGGKILITAAKQNNKVKVKIEDNGLGIPHYTLEEIYKLKSKEYRQANTTSLGINSAIKRLTHFFGDEFSWDLKSHVNKGTAITLYIPYRKSKIIGEAYR
jgi:two-component system LytT family sensor kinase